MAEMIARILVSLYAVPDSVLLLSVTVIRGLDSGRLIPRAGLYLCLSQVEEAGIYE